MPELPEVLTIKKDLHKEIVGKEVIKVVPNAGYVLTPSKEHFKNYVVGAKVIDVTNVAKLIVIKLSSDFYIATHLNMTGRLLYNAKDPYVKITLHFSDGSKLNYSSVRMFGYFEVWNDEKLSEYSKKYGKEALDKSLTVEEFEEKMKKRNTYIKTNLLDQKLVSGIGNIYANDALYLSKIHPKTKSYDLSAPDYQVLLGNVRLLLNEGLEHRGSSIDRYTDLYGKPGTHQNHFRVYGKRKGEPCKNCKTPITFEKIQERGTFYCPTCQVEGISPSQKTLF
jgi:formamidopyrimidine-DNA glycosylase